VLGPLTDNRDSNSALMMAQPIHRNSLVSPDRGRMWSTRIVRPTTATHQINEVRFLQCDLRDTQGVKEFFESLPSLTSFSLGAQSLTAVR